MYLTSTRSNSWVFDTDAFAHICNSQQELRNKRRLAKDEVTIRVGNGSKVDFGLVYGMMFALTGDGLGENELSDYARLLKREIGNLPGVARVNIYGERQECINICIRTDRMATLGVAPAEILSTLNGQNNIYYAGYYDNGDDRIRVTVSDKFRTAEQIGNMVIQGHEDDQLRKPIDTISMATTMRTDSTRLTRKVRSEFVTLSGW